MRILAALPFAALATVVFGLLATTCGLLGADAAARACARGWARSLLLLLGITVVVTGAEHCPAGAAVYAANHGSALDIPLLFAALPVDFRIIHKRSLYLVPVVGLYLFAAGHVGIDRGNAFRARRSLERAAGRIRSGLNVAVFPEGTRAGDAEVGHFKRGSFVLALAAGVPVVPVSLAGVKHVAPGGLRRIRPGRVRMVLHPPVATAGRAPDDAAALAEQVRRIVAAGCEAA